MDFTTFAAILTIILSSAFIWLIIFLARQSKETGESRQRRYVADWMAWYVDFLRIGNPVADLEPYPETYGISSYRGKVAQLHAVFTHYGARHTMRRKPAPKDVQNLPEQKKQV